MKKILLLLLPILLIVGCETNSKSKYFSNYSNNKRQSDRVSKSDFQILGNCSFRKTSAYYSALGEVKNIGNKEGDVKIQATARDRNGNMLDTFSFWANGASNISPKQTIAFD